MEKKLTQAPTIFVLSFHLTIGFFSSQAERIFTGLVVKLLVNTDKEALKIYTFDKFISSTKSTGFFGINNSL